MLVIRDRANIVWQSTYCNCWLFFLFLLLGTGPTLSGEVPIVTVLVILFLCFFYYFTSSTAFLGAWTYSKVEKIWRALAKKCTHLHISEVSHSDTLTSATYRFLRHTTHNCVVTPIDLTFCTDMQASVLYKIAIGTTNLCLLNFSAILNYVKNSFLQTPPTPYIWFALKLVWIITTASWSICIKGLVKYSFPQKLLATKH